jgi:hypothetical protein
VFETLDGTGEFGCINVSQLLNIFELDELNVTRGLGEGGYILRAMLLNEAKLIESCDF